MIHRIATQLLAGGVTLFLVISLTFVLMRVLPGGPFDEERRLPPAIQANIEARYHLDKPLAAQYVLYMVGILRGDLGPSYKYRSRRVNDIVAASFWTSFQIGTLALLLGLSTGLLLATWAGMTRNRTVDGLLSLIGVSSLSMPAFILGGILVLVFALQFKILPAARLETPWHYVLPVVSLSLAPFAYTFLLVRGSIREIRSSLYVAIKRSFGLDERTVAIRHVLRNSLLPLLSILGPMAAAVITGSFAVEYLFALPGMGKHFINAVANRDYPMVMGITLVYSALLVLFNTLTDVAYGLLDPRLRESARGAD